MRVEPALPARTPEPATARLLLVRHGETDYNREGRWQGSGSDPPLNAAGLAQGEAIAGWLATRPVAALYTSPQRRARETAAILGQRFGLEPRVVEELRELDHGAWEGRTQAEVLARWGTEYRAYETDPRHTRRPDGDSYADLAERVWPALERLARRHAGEEMIVVTHGGPIRLVLADVLGRPLTERHAFGVDNGSVFVVERAPHGWRTAEP